jgi:hypothetical protein
LIERRAFFSKAQVAKAFALSLVFCAIILLFAAVLIAASQLFDYEDSAKVAPPSRCSLF